MHVACDFFTQPWLCSYKNARTSLQAKECWTVTEVTMVLGVDLGTVRKWGDRFAAEADAGRVGKRLIFPAPARLQPA